MARSDVVQIIPLVGMGLVALMLLGLAMLAARKAAAPKRVKPRRRSFDAGRSLAREEHEVLSRREALEALRAPAVGTVERVDERGGHVRVAVRRRRSEPCDYVAGYLAGLFESAWASDVRVVHPHCAGKGRNVVCEYDVVPVVSPSAAPAGAGGTRGSAGGRRRWPQAPPGAG